VSVKITEQWPSMRDHVKLAQALYGRDGSHHVSTWLAEQTRLVDDADFANEFAGNARVPGIAARDYAHRHIRTTRGELLGGIRFRNRDTTRPFVDVLAHGFDCIDALVDCVHREWSNFAAPCLRLQTTPGLLAHRPDVILDMSIHVVRYRDMTPADGRVTLDPFESAEVAIDLVAGRYQRLADLDPTLARHISPAAPEDLRTWHHHDQVRAIRRHGSTIGALAIAAGAIGWITGDEINEELIAEPHTGHGYAASAQAAWAQDMATDRERLLVGTIHRDNHSSRATAFRAGRPRLLDNVFIAIGGTPTPSLRDRM
jgi:hypothetical protein